MLQDNIRLGMKRRIVEYSSYESSYKPEETVVGWERLVQHQGKGYLKI